MSRQIVLTSGAPAPIGPYSQAVIANGFVFLAGQVALVPETGSLADGGIEAQTHQVFANIRAVLQQAGASLEDVVKTTVYLQHLSDFAAMNSVYAQYLGSAAPARSTIEAARLPKDALVEIEVIAVVPAR
jgi:2-iminobutanoate/2-iminopropanoate deaminase